MRASQQMVLTMAPYWVSMSDEGSMGVRMAVSKEYSMELEWAYSLAVMLPSGLALRMAMAYKDAAIHQTETRPSKRDTQNSKPGLDLRQYLNTIMWTLSIICWGYCPRNYSSLDAG